MKNYCILSEKNYNFYIIVWKKYMFKFFGIGEENEKNSIPVQSTTPYVSRIGEEFQTDEDFEEIPQTQSYEEVGQIALDVLENHQSVYILAPVAGVELADIDIAVHETTLTISWVRNRPKEFYENSMQVKNEECFWGRFLRNIILPENMDFSQVKAVMENNLLVVHIPKIRFDSQNIKINRIES